MTYNGSVGVLLLETIADSHAINASCSFRFSFSSFLKIGKATFFSNDNVSGDPSPERGKIDVAD